MNKLWLFLTNPIYRKIIPFLFQEAKEKKAREPKDFVEAKIEELLEQFPEIHEEPSPYHISWVAWYVQRNGIPSPPWKVFVHKGQRIRQVEALKHQPTQTDEWRCGNIPRPDHLGGNYFNQYRRNLIAKGEPPPVTLDGKPNSKWAAWYIACNPGVSFSDTTAALVDAMKRQEDAIEEMLLSKGG